METFTSHAFYLMMSISILVLYNTESVDAQCPSVPSDQHTETVDTRHEGCYDIVSEVPYIIVTGKDTNIDIEACIESCYTDGFTFTGRKWGLCYCWSVIDFKKREDNMCIARCQNRGECLPCGSTLSFAKPAVLTSIYRTEPQDSRFIGCYDARQGTTDQVYALPWWPFESRSDLTVDICIDACKTKLFKYAGLAVKYCFCGNSEYYYFGKSSDGCNSQCSGINSQVCGSQSAGYAQYISVYRTGITPEDDRYFGCFSSIAGQNQVDEDNDANIMTIDICISRCHKMNKHAALKAGSECYCTDFTTSTPVPSYNGLCDTPCPGNASQTCGDDDNYAVYKPVCRPGTFGSGCDGQCHCLNQAVCDVKDGKCPNDECAPNWSGENCQDCAGGLFGPKCEGQCHCLNQEVCIGANGMCPGKCAEGWTGSNCQEKCTDRTFGPNCEEQCHCLNQEPCEITNGMCPGHKCALQWTGIDCQECAAGFFGPNCEGQCHCLNQVVCDSINGMCPDNECAPVWTGTDCQECAVGFFGPNCEGQCHCFNEGVCNSTTGMCPDGECAPQWNGTDCQECVAGFFGPKCEKECHCLNQEACDSTNGICPGNCAEGWTDSNCQQKDTTKVLGNGVGDWLYCQVWLNFRLTWSLACVSTYNLMCITVERYMEIIHPLYHKVNMTNRIAYVMMAGTWIYGFAYMMTYGIPFTGIRNGVCKRFAFYPSPTSKLIAGYVNFFNNLGIPVLIMVFSYTRMAFSLRASMSGGTFENKAEEMRVKRMQRAQANIYKTMFMVAACFMICWVPSQTNFFMFNLGCCGASVTSAVFMIAMTMAYANAIVNPFIYSLRYNDFQVAAKKLFFKSNKKKNNQMADNSSSTSTSTSVASKS